MNRNKPRRKGASRPLSDSMRPNFTFSDLALLDVIGEASGTGPGPLVEDLPPFFGSERGEETGDSTMAGIIQAMSREERENHRRR